ncbi:hypothetical protein L3081_00885 [Colwellia sp. MSW7]|uniref:Oligosaccharide flippase family protein n=1 Tax=Colwellia maritima TaxID=2912588 RepID=A0ABS9WW83_9GAMM|nr:oligosaccharide flippase family protein [Colwellia maritima]MCI2282217.1 hypothetical protein [Colwellia maritima]
MSDTKRILKSTLYLSTGQLIEIVTAIILMPFLILTLGAKHYGLWILINSIVGYLLILNMGLATAIERDLAKLTSSKLTDEYKCIFSSGLFSLIILSILSVIFVAFLSQITHLFIEQSELRDITITILWIFGIKTALLLPTIAFQAILSSELRHDLTVISEQVMIIVKFILIIFIVGTTADLVHLALIISFTELASRFLIVFFAINLKGIDLLSYTPLYYQS